MKNKKLFLSVSLVLVTFLNLTVFAQKKKALRLNKIKSETETVTEVVSGKETTYKYGFTAFDKQGNSTEETEYNNDGTIKNKITTKYDDDDKKTEEDDYETKGVLKKKHVYSYNSNGAKTLEITYDASNKILKKEVYTYNNKGLRTDKKVYDGANVLIETHRYTYE